MCTSFNSQAEKESQHVLSDTESKKKKEHAARAKRSYDVQWVMKHWKTCITCVSRDKGVHEGLAAVSPEADFHDLSKRKQEKEACLKKKKRKMQTHC